MIALAAMLPILALAQGSMIMKGALVVQGQLIHPEKAAQVDIITVMPQAVLTLNSGSRVVCSDQLILKDSAFMSISNNATLQTPGLSAATIEHEAIYIDLGSSLPRLEVQRRIEGNKGWRFLSSPVVTTYADMFDSLVTQGFLNSSFPEKQANLLWFNETDGGTAQQSYRTPADLNSAIPSGRGHFHYIFNGAGINGGGTYSDHLPVTITSRGSEANLTSSFNFNPSFTPRPNTDTLGIFVDQGAEGWNLLGNPSATSLDWTSQDGWIKTNIDSTIYIWDPSANSGAGAYLYHNGQAGTLPNARIAPYQAFWVHANAVNPVLSVNNQAKSSTSTPFLRNGSNRAEQFVELKLEAGGMEATSFLTFNQGALQSRDALDAFFIEPPSENRIEFFTQSSLSDFNALVINNLPLLEDQTYFLPLYIGGVYQGAQIPGSYHLSWILPPDWPSDWNISLHDHRKQTVVSMSAENSYSFFVSSANSSRITATQNENYYFPYTVTRNLTQNSQLRSSSTLPSFSIVIRKADLNEDNPYIGLNPILYQNYPNPFSEESTLRFTLPEEVYVEICIFDLSGRLIETLAGAIYEAGSHDITFNGSALSQGIYLAQLKSSKGNSIIKMVHTN
jgi:hypothetical protein